MADAAVEFKGTSFTLSVLQLKTLQLMDIRTSLAAKVAQAPDFFHLVPVLVNIEQVDDAIDYLAIKQLIEEFNFTFVGFTGAISTAQRASIRALGFSFVNAAKAPTTKPVEKKIEPEAIVEVKELVKDESIIPKPSLFSDKVHRGQIRSGQQIYAKGQNLVIIGSVSAGAEVIADGNIHIYGSLRGRAIAGAKGHEHAQIYCQSLEAELVSINGNYWLSDSMEANWASPVYIHLTGTELMSSKLI
jgi:septum site-determining protein MinC